MHRKTKLYDEILKRYLGKRLVKTIAKPIDKVLKEFGYMELVEGEMPDCAKETQYIEIQYEVVDNIVYNKYMIMLYLTMRDK